jgi:hypothetical protein
MKILNDIACNLNSMQIEFRFNSIQFKISNWIEFKFIEIGFEFNWIDFQFNLM